MAAFLLLLLPALAIASIDVDVTGQYHGDKSDLKVYFSGSDSEVLSNYDRKAFNLDEASLKDAVRVYFGKTPDQVYLRSPTPWGDLYSTFGWNQVVRTVSPRSGRILKITSEPEIVMQQVFENNSSKPWLFDVGIHQDVENTVASTWSQAQELNIGQDITYGFDISKFGGKTAFTYTSRYGQDYRKSNTDTVGATSSMNLLLKEGQSAVATLEAMKGTALVEIEYEATLSGNVAVNYDDSYNGHRFWAFDIQAIMEKGNLRNRMMSKEVIEINFYVTSKMVVNDKATGQKLIEINY